ncbi:acetoacetate decarboxylase family protein [Haloprofundus sp. MHR1]|uniref:acetoacetate decarboxylase family protein n=1 Tax=Haloprofundus sp. MHR1 TaxID=2572921 RepID=UPI00143D1506|nr:acetoacetate decarboxylase family protein [Haloprofundus sp. MHR1]
MRGYEETATLSTGHTVSLPLRCEADVAGATFTARWERLRSVVPDGLSPVRVAPRSGLVVLAGVRYRSVGGFDPYEEFAVVVPVVRRTGSRRRATRLGVGAVTEIGGYVHALPVTTEASKALGREVWGYPKTVADISVVDADGGMRVSVETEGATATTLVVRGGRTVPVPLDARATSYGVRDGVLSRAPIDLLGEGRVGVGGARLEIGDGPLGTTLGGLGVGRAVARFVAPRLKAHVHAPTPSPERERVADDA